MSTAKKTTPAKTPAKKTTPAKTPAKKAASSAPAPAKSGPRLVTWHENPEDASSLRYGVVVGAVDLGEDGKATRVALLPDLAVVESSKLKDA